MKENFLVDLSKQFAVDIVNLCTDIKENRKSNVLLNQVLRSGTSIGANIHEANYAASKADFINKFQIALKECYETDYWLGLFKDTHMITEDEYKDMFAKCSKMQQNSQIAHRLHHHRKGKRIRTNVAFEQNSKVHFKAVMVNTSKGI